MGEKGPQIPGVEPYHHGVGTFGNKRVAISFKTSRVFPLKIILKLRYRPLVDPLTFQRVHIFEPVHKKEFTFPKWFPEIVFTCTVGWCTVDRLQLPD